MQTSRARPSIGVACGSVKRLNSAARSTSSSPSNVSSRPRSRDAIRVDYTPSDSRILSLPACLPIYRLHFLNDVSVNVVPTSINQSVY